MKKMILLLGVLMMLPICVNAAPVVTTPAQVFYNTAGTTFSHDMQNLNRQRQEFEGAINYKQQMRRQAADEQVQETFEQIRNRTTQQGNLQFVQTSDGRIIIKRID
jgi:hypothetical protein